MTATKTNGASATARKDRSNESRKSSDRRKPAAQLQQQPLDASPAAGAHAAAHLTNEDATPGSGALTSHAHRSGKEVDGGAG